MVFLKMLLVIICLAAADIIVGFIWAKVSHTYKSSVMATGLYKKSANIILFCVLTGCGGITVISDALADYGIVVGTTAFVYIAVMEVVSIYENAKRIREYKEE